MRPAPSPGGAAQAPRALEIWRKPGLSGANMEACAVMRKLVGASLFGLALATACGGARAQAPATPQAPAPVTDAAFVEGVAAVVNDEVISTWDVRQRGALILISAGIQPSQEALEEVTAQALRSLVDERLQLQEAREFEIEIPDETVAESFSEIARSNNTTPEALANELARTGVHVSTLLDQLRADIAWRRLVGGRFGSRVRISEGRVKDTMDRIMTNAVKPQYLVSEIFLPAEGEAEIEQAAAAAERLAQEIRQGAPFQLVARQFSAAPSAAAGGDLGWLAQGELRPELQAAVEGLAPGALTPPIRSRGGVYLLSLRERREGVDPDSVTTLGLMQVSAPPSSRRALEQTLAQINGCEGLDAAMAALPGASMLDLGTTLVAELSDDMRARVGGLEAGQASTVAAAGEQVSAYIVCSRSMGEGMPDVEEIENRLYQQEVAMLSQRYLRNLRREATIITRQQ